MTDELPCAMLANGPACTSTGVPSSVCMVVGCSASAIRTVNAPVMPKSSAVRGSPSRLKQPIIRPRRARRSLRSVARASTAIISDATVMAKPVERDSCSPVFLCFSVAFCPTVTFRSRRSLVSVTLFHVIECGSMLRMAKALISLSVRSLGSVLVMPSFFSLCAMLGSKTLLPARSAGHSLSQMKEQLAVCSWYNLVSIAAANRLLAAVMAWMSPVMCRLNSSIGTH
mmetsp:Transcript_24083/g.39834  ORF Transcript_24083/g.39834 Transcript_24083/m.39834 type:complete len:227 (-) Transcript_24083:585-1265(-)